MSAAAPTLEPQVAEAIIRGRIREVLQTDNATVPQIAGVLRLDRDAVRLGLRQLAARGEADCSDAHAEVSRFWWITPPIGGAA